MSSWESLDLSFVISTLLLLPVDFSKAVTLRIPLASISKDTSICGTPLGIGGISVNVNSPSLLLSLVLARSPSNTWIVTAGWLSA